MGTPGWLLDGGTTCLMTRWWDRRCHWATDPGM